MTPPGIQPQIAAPSHKSVYLAPFRLLMLGHIPLVFYVGLSAWGTIVGLTYVHYYLQLWIGFPLLEFNVSEIATLRIKFAAACVVWSFGFPVILTLATLPTRIVSLQGCLNFDEIIPLTFRSFQLSIVTTYLAFKKAIYFLLPIAGVFILYHTYVKEHQSKEISSLFLFISFVTVAYSLFKIFPILASPILAIAGQFKPYEAVNWSHEVYSKRRLDFLAVTTGMITALASVNFYLHNAHFAFVKASTTELGAYAAIIWYGLTALAALTLQRIVEVTGQSTKQTYL